jgi:adenylate cyclase
VEEVRADRRRVVVLFADVVGYSTLSEHLDPEDLNAAMREVFAGLTASVSGREGMVEKYIGDAVMIVFGAPRAHEDDPERAVETALDMAEYIDRRSREMRSPLRVRIGINLGLVFSGPVGDGTQAGVMGDAVNVAARLQQSAKPGDILVSDAVWRRVRDRYSGTHVGALSVKGREQRVEAFRIAGRKTPSTPRLTPFIGREQEIDILEARWRATRAGSPQIVSLRGEAGVGKSRLLAEFPPRTDGVDIRVQCTPERSFGAFRSVIEQALGHVPAGIDELATALEPLGLNLEDARWLSIVLGHSDSVSGTFPGESGAVQRVHAAVHRFLSRLSASGPALVVLNDVHSADASSLETLDRLMELLSEGPLMLLLTYRPEVEVGRAGFSATHTLVDIEPLARRETLALAQAFLGTRDLPKELALFVADRAVGNPFFIEQLLQTLLEAGAVVTKQEVALVKTLDIDIPDTVERTVLARLDRLPDPMRHLLECASVIGPFLSVALLGAVAGLDEGILSPLEDLVASQFLIAVSEDVQARAHPSGHVWHLTEAATKDAAPKGGRVAGGGA